MTYPPSRHFFDPPIEVITGPMGSSKTAELLKRIDNLRYALKPHFDEGGVIKVFKPAKDERNTCVASRNGHRMEAIEIDDAKHVLDHVHDALVVGIDEAHFFDTSLLQVIEQLIDREDVSVEKVIVAGLNLDFKGKPFPAMRELILRHDVTKLHAKCLQCGCRALFSQRLIENEEVFLSGGDDIYEARCRSCFEPPSS